MPIPPKLNLEPIEEPTQLNLEPIEEPKPGISIGKSLLAGLTEGVPKIDLLTPMSNLGMPEAPVSIPTPIGNIDTTMRNAMYPAGVLQETWNRGIKPLTSPSNLALIGAAMAQPELIPHIAAIFGASQAVQLPSQVKRSIQSGKEKGWGNLETVENIGDTVMNALMTGGMLKGGADYSGGKFTTPPSPVKFTTDKGFGLPPPKAEPIDITSQLPPVKPPINPTVTEAIKKPNKFMVGAPTSDPLAGVPPVADIPEFKPGFFDHMPPVEEPAKSTLSMADLMNSEDASKVLVADFPPGGGRGPYDPAGIADRIYNHFKSWERPGSMTDYQLIDVLREDFSKMLPELSYEQSKALVEKLGEYKYNSEMMKGHPDFIQVMDEMRKEAMDKYNNTPLWNEVNEGNREIIADVYDTNKQGITEEEMNKYFDNPEEVKRELANTNAKFARDTFEAIPGGKLGMEDLIKEEGSEIGLGPKGNLFEGSEGRGLGKEPFDKQWEQSIKEAETLGIDYRQYDNLDSLQWDITRKTAQEIMRTGKNPLQRLIEEEGSKAAVGEENVRIDVGDRKEMIKAWRNTYAGAAPQVGTKELLQNAIDAVADVPGGHVDVKVDAKTGTITVADNGPGLTANDLKTVYTDITSSGKRGSGKKTIGEMGVGKATYTTTGDFFEVTTVARGEDGQLWKSSFGGTPEQLIDDAGVKITSVPVPEGTPTGTFATFKVPTTDDFKSLANYLDNFAAFSQSKAPVRIQRTALKEWDYWGDTLGESMEKMGGVKKEVGVNPTSGTGRLIGEGTSPGANFRITQTEAAPVGQANSIQLVLNVRGMFQGVDTIYPNLHALGTKTAELPAYLVVDIDPTVIAGERAYPLTAPTRERLVDTTRREVSKIIEKELVEGAAKKRQEELGKIFQQLVPQPGMQHILVDPKGKFTPEEIAQFANSPTLTKIMNGTRVMLNELMNEFRFDVKGEVFSAGYILDESNLLGVNVRNPANHKQFSIMLNPMGLFKMSKTPREIASAIVHATIHEFNHMIAREEGPKFTGSLANVMTRFDLEKQLYARRQIEKILGPELSDEIQSLLSTGEAAIRREGTTANAAIAEGASNAITPGQQGTSVANAKTSGTGNGPGSTITLRSPDVNTIKELHKQGYRYIGESEDGGMKFRFTQKKNQTPVLESDIQAAPTRNPKKKEEVGIVRQVYDLGRGLMSVDPPFITSAALRQAAPMIGTKAWMKSWITAAKAFGDKEWFDARMKKLENSPLFRPRPLANGKMAPSFAKEIGLRMVDLDSMKSSRMEGIRSNLAEKIPVYGSYVKASNRAFAGFLNDLKQAMLESAVKDGKVLAKTHNDPSLDITLNIPRAKVLADFINDSTGSGTLRTGIGKHEYSLEGHAQALADVFFSPRLMARNVRMMNPNTYIMAPKYIRKMYVHSMLRLVGAWWGVATLADMLLGQEVVKDPTSADFGKIKVGDTRIDPGAGFQQWLVLGSRMKPSWARIPIEPTDTGITPIDLASGLLSTPGGQYTSSTTERTKEYGVGYNPPDRAKAALDFLAQKMHPTAKLMYDIGTAGERKPVYLGDRILQLFVPMMTGDLAELYQEDPELIPLLIPYTGAGGGSQTYGSEPITSKILPEDYDIVIGGR